MSMNLTIDTSIDDIIGEVKVNTTRNATTLGQQTSDYIITKIIPAMWAYLFPIMALLGIIGNVLIMIVMLRSTMKRNKSFGLLLFLLAIADCMLIINPFITHHFQQKSGLFPNLKNIRNYTDFLCKFVTSLSFFNLRFEALILSLVSIDRFLVVIVNRRPSFKSVVMVTIISTLVCVLLDVPVYIGTYLSGENGECHDNKPRNQLWKTIREFWVIVDQIFNYVFLIVICVTNLMIVIKTIKYYIKRKQMTSQTEASNMKPPSSTTIMLLANVFFYLFLSLPAKAYYGILNAHLKGSWSKHQMAINSKSFWDHRLLWTILLFLQGLNPCVNFYVNYLVSDSFRKDLKASFFGNNAPQRAGTSNLTPHEIGDEKKRKTAQ